MDTISHPCFFSNWLWEIDEIAISPIVSTFRHFDSMSQEVHFTLEFLKIYMFLINTDSWKSHEEWSPLSCPISLRNPTHYIMLVLFCVSAWSNSNVLLMPVSLPLSWYYHSIWLSTSILSTWFYHSQPTYWNSRIKNNIFMTVFFINFHQYIVNMMLPVSTHI